MLHLTAKDTVGPELLLIESKLFYFWSFEGAVTGLLFWPHPGVNVRALCASGHSRGTGTNQLPKNALNLTVLFS